MRCLLIAALYLSVAIAPQALAQDNTKQFAVEGAGNLTCSEFIRARSDKGSAAYQRIMGFIEGFLTGANRYEANTFDLTPWHNAAALDLIIEKHCTGHPEDTLVGLVQRLVTGFRPIRVAQFSPLMEVGNGQNRAFVYEAILRRAQAALKLRGLYLGAEDGRYSPELRKALADFQTSAGLTATGIPDPATLWTLLNP